MTGYRYAVRADGIILSTDRYGKYITTDDGTQYKT